MSVMIVTSVGEIVVDLFTDKCPLTCKNFLKLCKIKYYNGCLFHTVQKDFTAQSGDPTGTGTGGDSVYKFLYGDQARFFSDEIHHDLKHSETGTVAMASAGENLNASQFYFTLRDNLDYLDGKHTVFGEVAEGLETLARINESFVDDKNRPLKNIRIKHTYILEDPFDDPPQLAELIPDASPEGKPKDEVDDEVRLEDDWVPMDEQLGPAELEEVLRAKEAHASAVVLESVGDIPDAEIKPPDNVLFVCKLNPVTEDEDLATIFSRFGTVISAEIIRDHKTGDSLCFAFIEFETREECEAAYSKMDNALIDDRRIHVDFSQSVAKQWAQYRRKDNQQSKGRGCFKCGALDHMAKDCTGDPATKQQPPKYILKNENVQYGGDNNSRYEMIFDGDSTRQEKRHGRHDLDYQIDRRKKDLSEKHRQNDRKRGHGEDGRFTESKASRYPQEGLDREKCVDRRKDRGDERRDDRDYRKRSSDGDRNYDDHKGRREEREHRHRGAESDGDERRGDRDYRKRSSDSQRNYDNYKGKREEREHRHRGAETDGDREYDRDRKNRDDKGRREEREHRHRGAETDGDREYDRDRKNRDDKRRRDLR